MNKIDLYDIISSSDAETPEQGDLVYSEILPKVKKYISNDEKFYVDFSNINNITTAFVNNCIGRLFLDFDREKIQRLMSFGGFSNNTQIKTLRHSLSNAIALSKVQ